MKRSAPPVDWRRAVANPALRESDSLLVPVRDLRALLAGCTCPAQAQPATEERIAAELEAGA